jgi:hypothetical protein
MPPTAAEFNNKQLCNALLAGFMPASFARTAIHRTWTGSLRLLPGVRVCLGRASYRVRFSTMDHVGYSGERWIPVRSSAILC